MKTQKPKLKTPLAQAAWELYEGIVLPLVQKDPMAKAIFSAAEMSIPFLFEGLDSSPEWQDRIRDAARPLALEILRAEGAMVLEGVPPLPEGDSGQVVS